MTRPLDDAHKPPTLGEPTWAGTFWRSGQPLSQARQLIAVGAPAYRIGGHPHGPSAICFRRGRLPNDAWLHVRTFGLDSVIAICGAPDLENHPRPLAASTHCPRREHDCASSRRCLSRTHGHRTRGERHDGRAPRRRGLVVTSLTHTPGRQSPQVVPAYSLWRAPVRPSSREKARHRPGQRRLFQGTRHQRDFLHRASKKRPLIRCLQGGCLLCRQGVFPVRSRESILAPGLPSRSFSRGRKLRME